MNKRKKMMIAASISAGILLVAGSVLAFFILSKGRVAKAENRYDKKYDSFCTYPHAKEIQIDGDLEEACWQDKKWFHNTYLSNTEDNMPEFKMTSYVDEYGIYIAMVSQDTNLSSDGQRHNEKNTNFELYLVGKDVDAPLENDTVYSIQLNIDMYGECNSYVNNFARAVSTKGKINSGETTSATLELFMPWETLGVDKTKGIPTKFYAMPAYYAVLTGQDKGSIMKPVWFPYKLVTDYYVFDKDGYINADAKDAVAGDAKFGQAKTANWDISQESEGILYSSTGTEHHRIFFKEHYGADFIVETTIVPVGGLNNNAPKAGIYFQTPAGIYNAVFLDMKEKYLTDGQNGAKNFETVRIAALDNEDNGWHLNYYDEAMYKNSKAASQEGTKLTVVKYGAYYWVFVDGRFITTLDYYFMDNDVFPGLYSLGGNVIYKDYRCKEINKKRLTEYVNQKGLFMIEAKTKENGGEVTTSEFSVEKGGSYDIELKSKSGYRVSSVMINGKEMIGDVQKNAKGGVYTVAGVTENQSIEVSFEKCDGFTFSGTVKAGEDIATGTVTLRGVTHKELAYEVKSSGKKGFSVKVPAGKYEVLVYVEGSPKVADTVTINKDTEKNYTVQGSTFAAKVTVNGKELSSKMAAWNMEDEHLKKVSTSYTKGGRLAPLYFTKTGADFAVETTLQYTTTFTEDGSIYQPDLMGGFTFHDGKKAAFLMAKKDGFVYTGYKNVYGLIANPALMYPDKRSVKLGVAKVGDQFFVYLNDSLVKTMDFAAIAPKMDAKSQLAIGLYMLADKTADIEFTNYSIQTGTSAAKKYIANKKKADIPIPGSSLFAQSVTVGGKQLHSMTDAWDLSDVARGNVMGSYALKTKGKPLYFNTHGSTILAETTISYTTKFKAGGDYQKDLMGGFYLTDGKNEGWVVANQTGVTYTGWNRDRGLTTYSVLTYDGKTAPRSVKMTMTVQGKYIYIFFDEECIWKQKLEVVVPGVKAGADMAVGLYMQTDKTSDIKFSNISITTNAQTVSDYITYPSLRDSASSMELKKILSGKYVSILGDSISSYEGISNSAAYHTTLSGYNAYYNGSRKSAMRSELQTYWGTMLDKYGMKLLVNNSCGGNRLVDDSGTGVTVSAGYKRVENLSPNTGTLNGKIPDIIFMYMGTNDYLAKKTIATPNYDISTIATPTNFTDAYVITLKKAMAQYPNAKIMVFTLLPSSTRSGAEAELQEYNANIREIAAHYRGKVVLVDIANNSGLTVTNFIAEKTYSFDGIHPNIAGMKKISKVLDATLKSTYLTK